MATIKEDYEIITNLIRQEIDKRKKQKQIKENLKNIEEDISLINKTEKKIKKKKKKSKTSAQSITISPNEKSYIKIDDYNDKYLNKDKTECVNEPMLLKKKKKKKKGEKKKVQNDIHLKTYNNVTLKGKKIYSDNCDDNEKHLKKEKLRASYLNKEILTSCIPIANALEVDKDFILLKIKKKKKKEEKKKIQNDIHLKNYNTILKAEKQTINNTEKLRSCIPIVNALEVDKKCILSKRKKKKMKKGVIEVQTEKNDNATLKAEKLYINTCYDNDKYLNKKNTEASGLIKDELTSRVSIANDLDGNKELTLFHKLLKIQKKEQRKAIKAVVCAETMSPKKSNKRKRQTTNKEYSVNKYPHSVDMDKEAYDSHGRVASEDSCRSNHKIEELNNANSVPSHENVHIGKTPLCRCDICFKIFTNKSKLCRHKKTHTSEKPYACNVCGRSFARKDILVKHNRTHTGEKPYTCKFCGQSFAQSSTLVDHKRTHTGEKPYTCNICGRSFTVNKILADHKRTHTGEKPYSCNICGRSFSQCSTLITHNRMHTGEKPYACDHCEKKFSTSSSCLKHTRNFHIKCF